MVGPVKDSLPGRRDWRISATLLAVWAVALVFLAGRRQDIPLAMVAMATVFFILLIPSMNDLVRSIEERVTDRRDGDCESKR